jgi:transposase
MFTKRSRFSFYKIIMDKNPITVSLDVHDNSTYIYAVDLRTGELLMDTRIHGPFKKTVRHLKKIGNRTKVVVLYEAGTHGFAPYRLFTKHGFETKVIAPSSIPKRKGMQKTDRDDSMNNLSLYVGGYLSFVTVPDEKLEQARDCMRYRIDTVWKITREKQRLHALIKRLGLTYTETKTFWTKAHFRWLKTVAVESCVRVVIDSHLENIANQQQQCETIEAALTTFFNNNPKYMKLKQAFERLRGVGAVNAMVLVLEPGDFGRFHHPKQIMKYVGLIPGKRQSGTKDPALHITKAGNKYLRTALVCAAKSYTDNRMLYSKKQLDKMSKIESAFINKMQKRLNKKYRDLKARGKHGNNARVAVAREMCGFIWEYATKIIPTIDDSLSEMINAA